MTKTFNVYPVVPVCLIKDNGQHVLRRTGNTCHLSDNYRYCGLFPLNRRQIRDHEKGKYSPTALVRDFPGSPGGQSGMDLRGSSFSLAMGKRHPPLFGSRSHTGCRRMEHSLGHRRISSQGQLNYRVYKTRRCFIFTRQETCLTVKRFYQSQAAIPAIHCSHNLLQAKKDNGLVE